MFIQADVELPSGQRVKLDEAAGEWFALIGVNTDPVEHLDEESLRYWRSLGARFLRVNRSRAGEHMRRAASETVILDDVQGGFRDWARGRADREIVLVRPDRYLAATCSRSEANAMTRRFMSVLPVKTAALTPN